MTPTTSAFVCLGPGVPRLEVTGKILKSKGSQHENTRDRRKFQGIVVMEKWIEMDPHFAVDQHQAMAIISLPPVPSCLNSGSRRVLGTLTFSHIDATVYYIYIYTIIM